MERQGSVLIIDDEAGVRSGIRQILEMEGYVVADAADGREALDRLAGGPFDVALIDYQLPDVDGLTLLGTLKEREPGLMTCMITAYASIDTAIAATRQGIDFFLPKPFLPDDLLGVLETLLRHKHLREEAERLRAEHEAGLLALAEEKSQTKALVQSLSQAVLVVNRDGDVVLANAAMTELLERGEDDVRLRPAAAVLAGGPLEELGDALEQPPTDHALREVEVGERTLVARIVTFRDDEQRALGRILTLSDISDVRRMALEKSRFVRTMVHELRSPLGAVKSIVDVALDRSLGDELEPYLDLLERAGARIDALAHLVGELLSLSQLELQGQTATEAVDVRPLVEEALGGQREALAARRLEGRLELAGELPPVVIDPDDLRTVLANLLGNAVKYNRDGGVVTVRAGRDDGWLRLDVVDTGLGIREENLPHVFDEFFREKRRETREIAGNGLGLSIVKRLVERVGGRLEVASVEGEGSTFTVLLPA